MLIAGLFIFLVPSILFFIYKIYVLPYLNVRYYAKQGGTPLFHLQLLSYFKNMKNVREKGDFYYLYKEILKKDPQLKFVAENFGTNTLLILHDPLMIKEMLQRYEIYQKDTDSAQLILDLAHGSTPFSEGADWKQGRRILSQVFNFDFIKDIIPLIIETTQNGINSWIQNKELVNLPLFEKSAEIMGETVGRFFFGHTFSKYKWRGLPLSAIAIQLGYDLFNEAFALTSIIFGSNFPKTNIFPRHRRINSDIAAVRSICKEMITETQRSGKRENNLLTRLLDLRKTSESEHGLSDEKIVGEFIGLFGAGTDTTSNLITVSVYFLSKYPEIFAKVKVEVDREFVDVQNLNLENFNRMEYTAGLFKEVLRFVVGCLFYRKAQKDDNLGGVHIKKGTLLTVLSHVHHTDEKYFKNPEEIIPERWINNTIQSQDKFKSEPFAYIPFSAGPRNCIGQHLAIIEAKILLGLFIKTFNFKIPENYSFKLVQGVVFEPMEPLLVTLEQKTN